MTILRPLLRPILRPVLSGVFGESAPLRLISPGTLNPGVSFARASAGTYVDADGVVRLAGDNVPRFQGAARRLLVEGARTNIALWSQTFSNAVWVKAITINPNSQAAPDGTVTGDRFNAVTGAARSVYQSFAVTPGQSVALSVWVLLDTLPASDFRMAFYDETNATFVAADVVPTGTLTPGAWSQASATAAVPAGCTSLRIYPFRRAPAVGGSFAMWGAQVEVAAFPSSYIPTTDAISTRVVDVPVFALSPAMQERGTITAWFVIPALGGPNQGVLQVDDGTDSARLILRYEAGVGGLRFRSVGGASAMVYGLGDVIPGALNKVTLAWDKATGASARLNDGAVFSISAANLAPSRSRVLFGHGTIAMNNPLHGLIGPADIQPVRALTA